MCHLDWQPCKELGSDAAQARPSAIVARCSLHILICQHWRPGWVQQQPAIAEICHGTSTRARACLGMWAWHARQQGAATSSLLPCMPCFQVIQQRASCRGNGNTSSKGPKRQRLQAGAMALAAAAAAAARRGAARAPCFLTQAHSVAPQIHRRPAKRPRRLQARATTTTAACRVPP